jgi:hypothetical protein
LLTFFLGGVRDTAWIANALKSKQNSSNLINSSISISYFFSDGTNDIRFAVYQPVSMMNVYPCEIASVPIDYRSIIFRKCPSFCKRIQMGFQNF